MEKGTSKVRIMHLGVPTEVQILKTTRTMVYTDIGAYEKPVFQVLAEGVEKYERMYGK